VPPQPSLAPLPGRPSTRRWTEPRTGRCRTPSLRHPSWASGAACLAVLLGPIHGRSPVLVDVARLLHGTLVSLPVQQVGSSFTSSPPQQSPSSTLWFGEWDPQSLIGCLSSTVPTPPTSVTDWVVDSGATNHTPPHPVTSSHPGLRRLPTIPTSLLVMVLSCSSPQ
jgi:hypothetical protein